MGGVLPLSTTAVRLLVPLRAASSSSPLSALETNTANMITVMIVLTAAITAGLLRL
jgi:hypothetical protein